MTEFTPDFERGTHGVMHDISGQITNIFVGVFIMFDAYAYGVLISQPNGDGWDLPNPGPGASNPIDTWTSETDMQATIGKTLPDGTKIGAGGMGNYEVSKIGAVQAIFDRVLDPTPTMPDHTNAEDATQNKINEVQGRYFKIIEDQTKANPPTYKLVYPTV